jgi:hypothetical protein
MAGPKNKGAINPDTYDGADNFMPAGAPTPAKQINATDAKPGPRKGKAGHINQDTFSE